MKKMVSSVFVTLYMWMLHQQNPYRSRPAIEDQCYDGAVGITISLDIGQSECPEYGNLAPEWSFLQHMNLIQTFAGAGAGVGSGEKKSTAVVQQQQQQKHREKAQAEERK